MAIDRTSDPLLCITSNGIANKAGKQRSKQNIAWRLNIILCALVTFVIVCVNVGVLVWTKISFPTSDDGAVTILAGSCETSKRIKLWVDLGVNIISTLLLAASNYCMQVLTSPVRSEIDRAHAKGKWMDIGVPSIRNLSMIAGWRVVLWLVLAVSSLPLHLFYNSVFFNTLGANDYEAALVTHEFLDGGWWNETRVTKSLKYKAEGESSIFYSLMSVMDKPGHIDHPLAFVNQWVSSYPKQLHHMQNNIGALEHLSNKECLQAYGTSTFESGWRNVLVVSNVTLPDNVAKVFIHSPLDGVNDEEWICHGSGLHEHDFFHTEACDIQRVLEDPDSWTIPDVRLCQNEDEEIDQCPTVAAKVDYCLAEPSAQHCTVQINTYLLVVVIVCNGMKLTGMLFTAFSRNFVPLANIGDAVASFLDNPEDRTRSVGPISIMDVRRRRRDVSSIPFKRKSRKWAAAVSVWRWIVCSILFLGLLAGGLALFFLARATGGDRSISKVLGEGIGSVSVNNLVGSPDKDRRNTTSFLSGVLLANTPQLFVSFADLLYNNAFTCMVLAHEWGSFASRRKGLRVSRRISGSEQRSTLKLQIPYRFVLPMKMVMPVLHWLVASSIFYLQLMPYDVSGTPVPRAQISACAYSPPAIFYAIILGGALVLALCCFSLRSLPAGMPLAGYCSFAISAACHAGEHEEDSALKRLQYGVIKAERSDRSRKERVGFSSRDVRPLVNGGLYQ